MAQLFIQNAATGRWVPVTTSTPMPAAESPSATCSLSSVASSTSQQTLAAATALRRGLMVYNDSTAILFLSYAAPITTSAYTLQIGPQGYWEMAKPIFTAAIYGIWASANGNARVTEVY